MFFEPICTKRCHYGPRRKWQTIFFGRYNYGRLTALRNFLFYQNIICFHWVMNLFLSWVMFFLSKKCHFQLKQQWQDAIMRKRMIFLGSVYKIFFDSFLDVSFKGRSLLASLLKMMSAAERCLLWIVHYIEVLLWDFEHHFICSLEKCLL